jgi:ATP-dependent HslUV protease subunit HslV
MTRRIREPDRERQKDKGKRIKGRGRKGYSVSPYPSSFILYPLVKMFIGTTILAIRHAGKVVVVGDGQVSLGQTVMKHSARKVRKLHHDRVIAGFAGATADAFTLFEKFEGKLEQFNGNLKRAAVELAKDWRTDRVLRRLEALLIVADVNDLLVISGSGDVVEPDDGLIAIGSGGNYALAAARVLVKHTQLDPRVIAEEAMRVAAQICVYTNDQLTFEELP